MNPKIAAVRVGRRVPQEIVAFWRLCEEHEILEDFEWRLYREARANPDDVIYTFNVLVPMLGTIQQTVDFALLWWEKLSISVELYHFDMDQIVCAVGDTFEPWTLHWSGVRLEPANGSIELLGLESLFLPPQHPEWRQRVEIVEVYRARSKDS